MNDPILSFVMSGGVGTRLWPLSRADNPKQFHDFSGKGSMLARTVRRLAARKAGESIVHLIASERHAERIGRELGGLDLSGTGVLFEPVGRNTAAAVAVATLNVLETHGDGLVLVSPSDHEIATDADFWATIEEGVPAAREGRLVVFGVPPDRPETGYGYIETGAGADRAVMPVTRFVEKPDAETARRYLESGNFFWNAGIFLFRASAMKAAFQVSAPDIWRGAEAAMRQASRQASGLFLPHDLYAAVPSTSIDYAVMERASNISMVRARFRWNDLGSWQSLLDASMGDGQGNVVVGDVVAIDCERSYLRSDGRLLSVFGLRDMAVVATADATFVAPVEQSQHVKRVVEQLERSGRLETRFTPAQDHVVGFGAWRERVLAWMFGEALPLWSTAGIDERFGGFHEALAFDGSPVVRPKRMRTMARQIYAFCVSAQCGWDGPALDIASAGIDFLAARGRTVGGGWIRAFTPDGGVADPTEDAYDHACVLLALAHASRLGIARARTLGEETFAFLDAYLEDERLTGFHDSAARPGLRQSNPHMHLLEAFLAWYEATGDRTYLRRAARIVDLFRSHLFDAESWCVGEFFDDHWKPAAGEKGMWTEPGHHFEWASLLVDFARVTGQSDLLRFARKLYASAVANGLNRATGLAYGAVSREGIPLDRLSRSWPQTEVIKAALSLDDTIGPDLKPEIEARMGRLFRWHLDPAPNGMWIDRIDEKGKAAAEDVPASIFYHLLCAMSRYLDRTAAELAAPAVLKASAAKA